MWVTAVVVAVLALIVMVAVMWFVPRLMLKRAIRRVVQQFRTQGAISPESAKTPAELRLPQGGLFAGMGRMRDYRPYAIRLLRQAGIIMGTDDGTVYLCEEALEGSPVKQFANVQ